MFPVVILAGGLATRLRPITESIPKALIEVAGQPFIFHQLSYLQSQGISKVVLCIGYLGSMIKKEVGNGERWGMSIDYSPDGPNLLGTGGTLKQALTLLPNTFFVLYGDSYLPINFMLVEKAFSLSQKPALLTVLKNANQWDASNVIYQDGHLIEYNKENPTLKMKYIDYGLSILSQEVFDEYEPGIAFDLSKVYNRLSIENKLSGFEVFERFYEIGSQKGISETETYLLKNQGNL